jgi:hypothetical protein
VSETQGLTTESRVIYLNSLNFDILITNKEMWLFTYRSCCWVLKEKFFVQSLEYDQQTGNAQELSGGHWRCPMWEVHDFYIFIYFYSSWT